MRTRILAASTTSLVIAASFAVVQSAAVATPSPPGPAIALPSLTTTSIVPGDATGGPGTTALNNAVSTACNSGRPIGIPQWYTLPTGDLGAVRASVVDYDEAEFGSYNTQLAFVNYTTNAVLACGGASEIAAPDDAAVVIYWDPAELLQCRTDPTATCYSLLDGVYLFATTANSAEPENDDSSRPATIEELPYTDSIDPIRAADLGNGGPIGLDSSACTADPPEFPNDESTVFWKYTAETAGDLPISVDPPRYGPPDNSPFYIPWVAVADITGGSPGTGVSEEHGVCGSAGTFPVTSGHTYLIEVSHLTNGIYGITPVGSGPLTLHVGAIGALRAPVDLTASDDGSLGVTLHWSAPDDGVGAYLISRDGDDSHGNGPQTTDAPGDTLQYTWPDLLPGHTYTFTVTTRNDFGLGVPTSVEFTVARPGAPTSVTSSVNQTAHSATLNWQPPTSTSGLTVTGYRVSRTGNDTANTGPFSTVLLSTARSETFTNMSPGSDYTLSVQAITAGGTSDPATATADYPGPPDEPSSVSATVTASAKSATLHWSPPLNNNGSAVTGYRVTRDGTDTIGGATFTATLAPTARSEAFYDLNAWVSYTLTVQAINALGTGLGYPITVSFTANTPAPPTGVAATRGNRTATVQWTAPTQTGGAPITGYRIRRFAGTSTAVQSVVTVGPSVHSYNATGLTNGSSYSFDVTANNSHGTGANSTRSNAVTPATVPNAPVIGTAVAGATGAPITATAHWSAPTVTGGSPITGYKVTALRMSTTGTVLATTVSSVLGPTLRLFTMTLPVAGNYKFTVQAVNAVGGSAQSARSNLVAGR